MKRTLEVVTVILMLTAGALAKSKPATMTFDKPCSTVWTAAKQLVTERYVAQRLDDQTMSGAFTITGAFYGTRNLEFSMAGEGGSCTVTAFDSFKKSVQNDKGHFLKNVAKALETSE